VHHDLRRDYDAVAGEYARRIAGELDGKPLDRALLEEGRRRFPAVRFTEGDLLSLPLLDASQGGAVAFYSLIHLAPEEWPRALAEARRVPYPEVEHPSERASLLARRG
jgi:ubiquinone/menaquinone biosynthesis C-methylase UbiE